jgi:hypothetical protein
VTVLCALGAEEDSPMPHDSLPIHEYWRKLTRLIAQEQDEVRLKELLDQLVLSYQEEISRLSTAN